MLCERPTVRARREAGRPAERRHVEDLLRLAEHLPPRDRALVEAVYRDGRAVRLLAAVGGGRPSTVSQRLRSVIRRMHSPEFRLVALRGSLLDPRDRRTAELLFLAGQSTRAVARRTGRPLHQIRRLRDAIRQLVVLLAPEHEGGNP